MERRDSQILSAPIGIQWEVTPWCNQRCVHCYNYWKREPDYPPVVNSDTIAVWQKTAEEIIKNKVFYVIITGGEPLAVFRHLYPFLTVLHDNKVDIRLNSNLTMLTREKASLLKTVGVKSILTSLTSYDPDRNTELTGGNLRATEKGIRISLETGLRTSANMVVTKKNLPDIYETASYAKSLGIKSFSATRAATPARGIDFSKHAISNLEYLQMLNELIRVKNKLGMHVDSLEFYPPCSFETQEMANVFGNRSCTAGRTTCTIGFDGQIRPCPHSAEQYGSIAKDGLTAIWNQILPWRDQNLYLPEECQKCDLKSSCKGGCRVEAQCRFGNFNSPDPLSDYSRQPQFRKNVDTPVSPDVSNEQKLYFYPELRSREEQFGGILFTNLSSWVAIDRNLFGFYTEFRNQGFSMNDLAKVLNGGSKEVRKTAQYFLQRGIIKKGGD